MRYLHCPREAFENLLQYDCTKRVRGSEVKFMDFVVDKILSLRRR